MTPPYSFRSQRQRNATLSMLQTIRSQNNVNNFVLTHHNKRRRFCEALLPLLFNISSPKIKLKVEVAIPQEVKCLLPQHLQEEVNFFMEIPFPTHFENYLEISISELTRCLVEDHFLNIGKFIDDNGIAITRKGNNAKMGALMILEAVYNHHCQRGHSSDRGDVPGCRRRDLNTAEMMLMYGLIPKTRDEDNSEHKRRRVQGRRCFLQTLVKINNRSHAKTGNLDQQQPTTTTELKHCFQFSLMQKIGGGYCGRADRNVSAFISSTQNAWDCFSGYSSSCPISVQLMVECIPLCNEVYQRVLSFDCVNDINFGCQITNVDGDVVSNGKGVDKMVTVVSGEQMNEAVTKTTDCNIDVEGSEHIHKSTNLKLEDGAEVSTDEAGYAMSRILHDSSEKISTIGENASPLMPEMVKKSTSSPITASCRLSCNPINANTESTKRTPLKRLPTRSRKMSVKSPHFMNAPSSLYAAICVYQSSLSIFTRENIENNKHSIDSIISHLYFHFGSHCQQFKAAFDNYLAKTVSPHFRETAKGNLISIQSIEKAFHYSVRHPCSHCCFLRAYAPIREWCLIWNQIKARIDLIDDGCQRQYSIDEVMHGWLCILPPSPGTNEIGEKLDPKPMRSHVVFASPDGTIYKTKSSAIRAIRKRFCDGSVMFPTKHKPQSVQEPSFFHDITKFGSLNSPLGLLEEIFVSDPWKLLLSTIFLNKTQRGQVDPVFFSFLEIWPDAVAASLADWTEIFKVIAKLGLGQKRSQAIVRFSCEYLELVAKKESTVCGEEALSKKKSSLSRVEFLFDRNDVLKLHNCGEYAWSAYEIFILNRLPNGSVKVCDHALQMYVEYQIGHKTN